MNKNFGVISLALFLAGCATPITQPECDPVCEMVDVCEDVEDCSAVLVESGTTEFCELKTVEISETFCNDYLDTMTFCSSSATPYTSLVVGSANVTSVLSECSSVTTPYSEVVTGTTSFSYTNTECSSVDSPQVEEVCTSGICEFVRTDCETESLELDGEVCQAEDIVVHRLIDFDSNADGDPIASGIWGSEVELAYSEWGVSISVSNYDGSDSATDVALFDSLHPTGQDDDLGTMNSQWDGVGVGSGGPSTNFFERGNVLIHAEDLQDSNGDGILDDPDDDRSGGNFLFEFSDSVCIQSIALIDIEPNENGYLKMFDGSGSELFSQQIIGLGNNSVQVVDPKLCGVSSVIFEMCGSGAIDDIHFTTIKSSEVCLDWESSVDSTSCEDSDVTETLEVCSEHTFTCSEQSCVETEITESITTDTVFDWTCSDTVCVESSLTEVVNTETNFQYTCEETQCIESEVPIQVCGTHTIEKEIEVCIDVPDLMAGLSCTTSEVCTKEEVCDNSTCGSDTDAEWLSGGGPAGTR